MKNELAVFMVTHNVKCHIKESWIIPMQVGIKNATDQFEKITDNTGDNISKKNKTFCELTGLYWIWKNTKYKYIGICHYRRVFKIKKEEVLSCLNKGEIIVPKLKYFKMSVQAQYIREHGNKEWNIMLEVIKELFPEYYNSTKIIFGKNRLYSYNMFIGDKRIIDKYCLWLFAVLFEVEKRVGVIKKDSYQARYIGFLAERLFTLYIVHNGLTVNERTVLFNGRVIWLEKIKCIVNNIFFKVIQKVKGDIDG